MATIADKTIIDEMLRNEGRYESDPPPFCIFEFKTPEGAAAWSVCYNVGDAFRFIIAERQGEFALDAKLIWPLLLDELIKLSKALIEEMRQPEGLD